MGPTSSGSTTHPVVGKMMPHHRDMVRSLCPVRAGLGKGLPLVAGDRTLFARTEMPPLPRAQGVTGAHLLQSQPMPAATTTEQKIRGGDASADWVVLIGGYDSGAVKAAVAALPSGMTALFLIARRSA